MFDANEQIDCREDTDVMGGWRGCDGDCSDVVAGFVYLSLFTT